MRSDIDVVLVYLGGKFPKYVAKNLSYLKSNFPNYSITFVGDSEQTLAKASELSVNVFKTSNWIEISSSIYNLLDHPMKFRSGFWFHTIARFFAIAEFQKASRNPLLQVECDVFLSKNFPFEKFLPLKEVVAYPMENVTQGAASVLWIGNDKLSAKLVETSLRLIRENPKHTDMTILGEIACKSLLPFTSLPTIHPKGKLDQKSNLSDFSRNFYYFKGCFDALSYGMYMLGSDPRNKRGLSEVFKNRSEQVLPDDIVHFGLNKSGMGIDIRLENGVCYPLFCLHNHSKNSKIWTNPRALLSRRFRSFTRDKISKQLLYPSVLISLLGTKLKRFVFKVNNDL
jgi:hypothetical protein